MNHVTQAMGRLVAAKGYPGGIFSYMRSGLQSYHFCSEAWRAIAWTFARFSRAPELEGSSRTTS